MDKVHLHNQENNLDGNVIAVGPEKELFSSRSDTVFLCDYPTLMQDSKYISDFIYYKLTGVKPMMTYDPFWRMMDERRISTYSLEVDYGFNKAFIHRLKHNKNMTLSSIDYICDVFSCSVEDVVVHIGIKEGSSGGYRLNAGDR